MRQRLCCMMRVLPTLLVFGGCGDATGPGPDTITVTGVVVDEYLNPQGEASVLIVGHDWMFAELDGSFTVRGVTRPYDLAVGLRNGQAGALLYVGLTRNDPLVVLPAHPLVGSQYSARLVGPLSGIGDSSDPPNHRTSLFFESAVLRWPGESFDNFNEYRYRFYPRWNGPAATTGSAHALQWQFDPLSGLPVEYTAYGRTEVTLTDGMDEREGPDLHMEEPVHSGLISGSVNLPPGHDIQWKKMLVGFGSGRGGEWEILTDTASSTDFDYLTPDVPDVGVSLWVRARAGGGYREIVETDVGTNASDLTLSITPAPVLLSPADGYAGVDDATHFSWTGTSDAVYLFGITYIGSGLYIPPPSSLYVLTTETSFTIPRLGQPGLRFYAGSPYVWQVFDYTPFGSVDEIAAPSWFLSPGDRSMGGSAPRQFFIR